MVGKMEQEFLQDCVHEYKCEMDIQKSVSKTLADLREGHHSVKDRILKFYKNRWHRKHGSLVQPPPIRETLRNLLENEFKEFGKHYDSKIKVDIKVSIGIRSEVPALGVDLGTTMCCVKAYFKGKLHTIPNRNQANSTATPSYVGFQNGGTYTFGTVAKEQSYRFPESTIYDAKRMIGKLWNDPNLQECRKTWPFELINENNHLKIKSPGRSRYPQEISAILLHKLRAMAESHLQLDPGSITKVVVTVPAYFNEPQRRATREAAKLAGMEVLNILSEPTAASIAYNWERSGNESRKVLVYDLGGGTFDVAIAEVSREKVNILTVDGDTHLGGQDIDQLLMDYCIKEFKNTEGYDLTEGLSSEDKLTRDKARRALARLKLQCEKVKERLSSCEEDEVDIACITSELDFHVTITRNTLEDISKDLVKKTIGIVETAIGEAKSKGINGPTDIDDVILIGGSTRMPLIIRFLEEYFGKKVYQQIHADEAVAHGAAIQAAIITGQIETLHNFVVQDVTPFSIGIECLNDTVAVVIPKNSTIPCEHTTTFYTDIDLQTSLRFTCCQGESKKASENKQIGEFYFYGIPARPAKEEKINVNMAIDNMGILNVTAVSVSTKNEKSITISVDRQDIDRDTMELLMNELQV